MEDNNDNKKEEKERRWELVSLSAKKRGGICISQTQSNVFIQKLLAVFLTRRQRQQGEGGGGGQRRQQGGGGGKALGTCFPVRQKMEKFGFVVLLKHGQMYFSRSF